MDLTESLRRRKEKLLTELERHFDPDVVLRARIHAKALYLSTMQKNQYSNFGDFSFSEVIGGKDSLGINRELKALQDQQKTH